MTDQPTAPQTWDTLPDDIPFPIVVGWEARTPGVTRRSIDVHDATTLRTWIGSRSTPDWWMPWPTFAPDPMTVNQWHDMALLPDGHPETVWIENKNGDRWQKARTRRDDDAKYGRKRWRSESAMLAHVGGTIAAEARGEG